FLGDAAHEQPLHASAAVGPHDDQVRRSIARVADDLRGRVALEEDVVDGDVRIDGTDLLELFLPVPTFRLLVAVRAGGDGGVGAVDEQHRQAGAVGPSQGDGVEVRLVGVGREVGWIQDLLDANHAKPPGTGAVRGPRPWGWPRHRADPASARPWADVAGLTI